MSDNLNNEVSFRRRSQSADIMKRFIKNKAAAIGLIIIMILLLCSLFPGLIAPYGIDEQDLTKTFIAPNSHYLFGTDNVGRDIFSRVIYGARLSLSVGLISVSLSCVVGILLGLIAGYYSGFTDNVIMRFIDVLLSMPQIMLAISIVAALGPGFQNLIIAIGIGSVPGYARIIRGSVLSVKEEEFVEAAHAIGSSDFRIMLKHILPNCMAPIIVQATMSIAYAILSAAALSFIGLGISPPTPEWGSMLSSSRPFLRDYWWVVTFPGIAIMITVYAFNLFGDGLRDALDPRLKN